MTVPDRMLRVDLTTERVRSEPVPEAWLARYVGGKGLGARYLYEMEPGVDPASPANRLAFAVGPLTGYLPGEPRYAAVTKSPLTGAFLDSYGGGSFASRLAGSLGDHLGVVIEGAADDPVVLSLAGGEATIEPADDLRGLDAAETDARFPDAPSPASVRRARLRSGTRRSPRRRRPPRGSGRRGRSDGREGAQGGRRPRSGARGSRRAPRPPRARTRRRSPTATRPVARRGRHSRNSRVRRRDRRAPDARLAVPPLRRR
ncbi:aldehyde ferredoxin oxidoreductase N-terminal domain-containing protein [Halorubrum saccharovorum]|uniref:aldehyde ferredoxin oxidoreductase N-terminal domain-containing protein n=1 Tax=Halorubrum saccharovorum TaxID=2248 RepID=UPI001F283BB9|nr:aldehyde ferredoxin oxidoreductase N-terminal domain-containing protein [Halorubrum saccharovorum]